jgi:cyclophilin family peptidyl-prolyl cis-trans isomerase
MLTRHTRIAAALAAAALAAVVAGCGDDGPAAPAAVPSCHAASPTTPDPRPTFSSPPEETVDAARRYTATLVTTEGDIVIRLQPDVAPHTVTNFIFLACNNFYDGVPFHRVVRGFVIQTGDPEGTGAGGPGYTFADELPADGYRLGSVAMANTGPDSNGSQFFIVTGDPTLLNVAYSRFGQVVRGLDVAQGIEALARPDANDFDPSTQTPSRPVTLLDVRVRQAG